MLEVCSITEHYGMTNNAHYDCGNYFRTKKLAEQALEVIRNCLHDSENQGPSACGQLAKCIEKVKLNKV